MKVKKIMSLSVAMFIPFSAISSTRMTEKLLIKINRSSYKVNLNTKYIDDDLITELIDKVDLLKDQLSMNTSAAVVFGPSNTIDITNNEMSIDLLELLDEVELNGNGSEVQAAVVFGPQ